MDVDELLALDRQLTAEEAEFMEHELLKLVRQLESEIDTITAELDTESRGIMIEARDAARSMVTSIEAAIAEPLDTDEA